MKLKFDDLLYGSGKLSRAPFLIWAGILFAIKYNLDRLLLWCLFERQWSVFSYFDQPLPGIRGITPAQTPGEFIILLTVSFPFLWAGIMLCLKRLRSAQLPLWLAFLFVLPFVKWFLFISLALVPDRNSSTESTDRRHDWLPSSVVGSAALAIGISVLFAAVATLASTIFLRDYGWGLFVGVPFCLGFFSALIHGARHPRRLGESLAVALLSVAIAGVVLLVLAIEGLICLVMAAPLAVVLALIGGIVGHTIQVGRRPRIPPQVFCLPVLAVPLMFASEMLRPGPAPLLKVVTSAEVDAPIETVWRNVVAFAELPAPTELLFKLGIAYPIRAEIRGRGPGAMRNCIFSTGPFVEPIEVWQEPSLLKFSVAQNPAPLDEWTPYHQIHPPHLEGFLVSEQGQFELKSLPGGRTLLQGTTWYRHGMWPAPYWQIWSDQIIHTIHRRVLRHIKESAERETKSLGPAVEHEELFPSAAE